MAIFLRSCFNNNRSINFSTIIICRLKEKPFLFPASIFHWTQPVRTKLCSYKSSLTTSAWHCCQTCSWLLAAPPLLLSPSAQPHLLLGLLGEEKSYSGSPQMPCLPGPFLWNLPLLSVATGRAPTYGLMHLKEPLGSWGSTYVLCPGGGGVKAAWEVKRSIGVPFVRTGTFLCHKTESTYGLYKFRAVISGTGSHSLTNPGNRISRYCANFSNQSNRKNLAKIYHLTYAVMPKRRHKKDTTNLRDKTRLTGSYSLVTQDNVFLCWLCFPG